MRIQLLADAPELIRGAGELRHREWGHPPEPTDVEWWIAMTERETGRTGVPVTFVATDDTGAVVGTVGLGEFDIPERRDRSPWILGMLVRPDHRNAGLGATLLAHLHAHATAAGYPAIWVATEQATRFYENHGYQEVEHISTRDEPLTILRRPLP